LPPTTLMEQRQNSPCHCLLNTLYVSAFCRRMPEPRDQGFEGRVLGVPLVGSGLRAAVAAQGARDLGLVVLAAPVFVMLVKPVPPDPAAGTWPKVPRDGRSEPTMQRQTDSQETSRPRSASNSSTSRRPGVKRRKSRTACRTADGNRRRAYGTGTIPAGHRHRSRSATCPCDKAPTRLLS
jgi:hypothetical protein